MNERFIFNIVSGASVMNVAGQDADLYPALPALTDISEFTLPQDSLRGMIEKTQFAIAVDDAREVLTGALLEIAGGDATMVALDGFRMAYKREKVSDVMDVIRAIIPGRAVGDLAKLLSSGEDAFATLAFGVNGRLQVRLEKTDIYVTLISGEYINYRRLLPTSFKMRAVAALEPLRQCIDRARSWPARAAATFCAPPARGHPRDRIKLPDRRRPRGDAPGGAGGRRTDHRLQRALHAGCGAHGGL